MLELCGARLKHQPIGKELATIPSLILSIEDGTVCYRYKQLVSYCEINLLKFLCYKSYVPTYV